MKAILSEKSQFAFSAKKAVVCVLLLLLSLSIFAAWGVEAINGSSSLTITSNIPTSSRPSSAAVNTQTNRVYIGTQNSLLIIDGATDTIITEISIGKEVAALAVNPVTNRIYVGTSSNITVIDGSTNLVVGTIMQGVYATYELAINPAKNWVYVSDWTTVLNKYDAIQVYDGSTYQLVTTINIPDSNTHATIERVGVAVNPTTNMVYATWRGNNTVYLIDANNNHAITKMVKPSAFLDAIMVNPTTNLVYTNTSILNGATLTETTPGLTGIVQAIDPVNNGVYSLVDWKILYLLNGTTHAVVATLTFDSTVSYGYSTAIAVNPQTAKLYVGYEAYNSTSRSYNNQVSIVGLATVTPVTPAPVTSPPVSSPPVTSTPPTSPPVTSSPAPPVTSSPAPPATTPPPTTPQPTIDEFNLSTQLGIIAVAIAMIMLTATAVVLKRKTK